MLCKVKVMFYYTEKKFKFKYLNTFICSAKMMMSLIKGNNTLHDSLDSYFLGGSLNKDCFEAVNRQAGGNKKKKKKHNPT